MSNEKFLIDSNSFIEPYERYYPFDFAENFWKQLGDGIENGSIVLLDLVKDEISKGNDPLSNWINKLNIAEEIDHRTENIIKHYGEILEHIQNASCYQETALENWAQEQVADAWLIATAMANDYTIITFEQKIRMNGGKPSKSAKIPNVAENFNVKVENLFYLMRALNFKL